MALDFHILDSNEYLFRIDNEQYALLSPIFESFYHWTGLEIDQYKDF